MLHPQLLQPANDVCLFQAPSLPAHDDGAAAAAPAKASPRVARSCSRRHHKPTATRCKAQPDGTKLADASQDRTLPAGRQSVAGFLATARKVPPSPRAKRATTRILFALDATASREPTWDMATNLHAELFEAAAGAGVAVQLAYYRGYREFHASPWSASAPALLAEMTGVGCRGGLTQIARLLRHALAEAKRGGIDALVFVGDACEEPADQVAHAAGQLAVLRVPCFLFQEGTDPAASRVFRDVAALTGGAHVPFAPGSAAQLRALFGAVAAYAAHGRQGVKAIRHDVVRGLLAQLP